VPIRSRKVFSNSSRYVRYDPETNSYDYRTPSDVVMWPQTFRERIIRDWNFPNASGMYDSDYSAYARHMEKEKWSIRGHTVTMKVKHLRHSSGRYIPLTFVLSNKNDKALLLDNHNPIIRSLMTYSFLKSETIGGLPELKLIDKHVLLSVDIGRLT
jgi:hypothetical protein